MVLLRILPRMFSKQWIITTALVVIGAAVCARLGFWQLARLDQRRAFNAQVTSMRALPALDMSAGAPADIAALEYRAVIVSGTYDYENQVAIRNQYLDGVYGFNLLTPLRLADGTVVLVDRGWIVAEDGATREGWPRYEGPQPVRVEGLIRLSQAESTIGGVTDPTLEPGQARLDYWTFVNLERIGQQLPYPILPVYIQQRAQADPNLPTPHPEEIDLTEGPHFGYALQWFTFASLLLFGYPFYLRKQEERPS